MVFINLVVILRENIQGNCKSSQICSQLNNEVMSLFRISIICCLMSRKIYSWDLFYQINLDEEQSSAFKINFYRDHIVMVASAICDALRNTNQQELQYSTNIYLFEWSSLLFDCLLKGKEQVRSHRFNILKKQFILLTIQFTKLLFY